MGRTALCATTNDHNDDNNNDHDDDDYDYDDHDCSVNFYFNDVDKLDNHVDDINQLDLNHVDNYNDHDDDSVSHRLG